MSIYSKSFKSYLLRNVKEQGIVDMIYKEVMRLKFNDVLEELKKSPKNYMEYNNGGIDDIFFNNPNYDLIEIDYGYKIPLSFTITNHKNGNIYYCDKIYDKFKGIFTNYIICFCY